MRELPEGFYPFVDQRLPLADMAMVEAPPDLEALFKRQAAVNGLEIIRDEPIELRCQSEDYPDATFLVYWPLAQIDSHAGAEALCQRAGLTYLCELAREI